MLGPILLSIHNLTYYQRLMAEAREAIAADSYGEFRRAKSGWLGHCKNRLVGFQSLIDRPKAKEL